MIVALATLVCLIAAGTALAVADTGDASCGREGRKYPTTILSGAAHATVSWQVRSSGSVRLRLYRSQTSGGEILVNEVTTSTGETSFEFVDENRPPGGVVYVLRVHSDDGSETTLGSALCVEPKFAPSDVISTNGSYQPAWPRTTRLLSDPRSSSIGDQSAIFHHGFIPAPDPPVPR